MIPVGLRNVGNTCAINALIQCIRASKVLRTVLDDFYGETVDTAKTVYQLRDIFKTMKESQGMIVQPFGFLNHIRNKYSAMFQIGEPHDITELWTVICDGISEENKIAREDYDRITEKDISIDDASLNDMVKSIIIHTQWKWIQITKNVWSPWLLNTHGLFVSQILCHKCDYYHTSFELFSTLSVPVSDSQANIISCIDRNFESEELCSWKCEKCNGMGGKKISRIARSPNVLVVIFKRYEISNGRLRKICTPIRVDDNIDIANYCYGHVGSTRFELISVGNQYGGELLHGGHYVTIAKYDQWYVIDDSCINPLKSGMETYNAYIAFYEKM